MPQVKISDAGIAISYLTQQLEIAEERVRRSLCDVLNHQTLLSKYISERDAIERTINLTAKYVVKET